MSDLITQSNTTHDHTYMGKSADIEGGGGSIDAYILHVEVTTIYDGFGGVGVVLVSYKMSVIFL